MRPILIDTNVYSAFKRREDAAVEVIQNADVIAISPIVLGELLSGFECGNRTKKNREELHEFLQTSRIKLFSITSDTANFYCQTYFSLKNKGKPIPTNDIWIAAQALENGCVLCTYDSHFKAVDNLICGSTFSQLAI